MQNTMMQKEEKIATNRSPAVFGRGDTGVRHVGLYARDPAATAEFYRDVMGMQIIGGSSANHLFGASAFLTSCPGEEAHELALFANQDFRHFAFRVASLAELLSFYHRVLDRKVEVKMALGVHRPARFPPSRARPDALPPRHARRPPGR